MDEIEFLEAMLNYETINKACRAKRISNKDKDKKSKDLAAKKQPLKNRSQDLKDKDVTQGKYHNTFLSARKTKKYCSYCKENGGKY